MSAKKPIDAPSPAPDHLGEDDAIDDSEDLDDEYVEIQKTISETRRVQSRHNGELRVQEVLPFQFLPNIRPLTVSDLESCIALENAAFANPEHRFECNKFTERKFEYRLSTCPELCMGVFCTVSPASARGWEIDTLNSAKPVETGRDDGSVSVLFAHIIGTRTDSELVTDAAMDYPRDFRTTRPSQSKVGHQEGARTVAIHSLSVHPKLHGCGLGKLIMKAYMQQINNSGTADRISLISQGYLVNYYVRFGFQHKGESRAQFGGGGWHDLTFELAGPSRK
ncbi:polyamine acetyltransferase [Xylariales sp. PMI_506]|nr:polyamine acetyltransferase [Xylariales sp. PMI_506]